MLGLFSLSQEELKEPKIAIRDCLNENGLHPFVSLHPGNRRCPGCKKGRVFQAA